MPNLARTGFRWVGHKNAPDQTNPPIVIVPVADDFAVKLTRGLPVKRINTGYLEDADPGDAVYGIFSHAVQYYDASLGALRSGGSLPAATSYDTNFQNVSLAAVIPVRDQLFEATCDDATTFTTYATYLAALYENVEWAVGTAVADYSGAVLDISGHGTGNTLSVRIEDIPDRNLQDFSATNVRLVVSFNLIQDTASGSTTGT